MLVEYVVLLDDEAMASILFARVRQCISDFVGLAVRVAESAYISLRNSRFDLLKRSKVLNNIADHLVVWSRSISSDFSESCNEHSRM